MIIWINGSFGSGKTTLAEKLVARIEGSYLFDPEDIGSFLRKFLPPAQTGDYQDLQIWRDLVVECARSLDKNYPEELIIVPMSVIDKLYEKEIFGKLKSLNIELRHIWLKTSYETLANRKKSNFSVFPQKMRGLLIGV